MSLALSTSRMAADLTCCTQVLGAGVSSTVPKTVSNVIGNFTRDFVRRGTRRKSKQGLELESGKERIVVSRLM